MLLLIGGLWLINGKPNPPNMRRRRYSKWLDRCAKLLKETGEALTASRLMNSVPDDKFAPGTATAAAQKLRKDKRFGSFVDYTTNLEGHRYKTSFFFYDYLGEQDEE